MWKWPFLAVFLGACASHGAENRPDFANRWVGQPLDSFVIAHGAPQTREPLSGGRSMVEWASVHGTPRTGSPVQDLIGSAGGVQTQAGSYQLTCRLRFVVGRNGVIEQAAVVTDTYGMRGTSRCAEVFARN